MVIVSSISLCGLERRQIKSHTVVSLKISQCAFVFEQFQTTGRLSQDFSFNSIQQAALAWHMCTPNSLYDEVQSR